MAESGGYMRYVPHLLTRVEADRVQHLTLQCATCVSLNESMLTIASTSACTPTSSLVAQLGVCPR